MTEAQTLPSLPQAMQSLGDKIADPEFTDLPEEQFPGLPQLIKDWFGDTVLSREHFFRRLLHVFQNSTLSKLYDQELSRLDPSHRASIEAFAAGKPLKDISHIGKEYYHEMDPEDSVITEAVLSPSDFIKGHTSRSDYKFENWGQTVSFTPAITFYPKNTAEIQTIVRHSIDNHQAVRVSGFRHSWSPIFGRNNRSHHKDNGDVMISMQPEYVVGKLPNLTALPSCFGQPVETELSHIGFVDADFVHGGQLDHGQRYVRIGAATTNQRFRRWCCDVGKVTFPANVLMVEMTIGGVNAPICHGAGIQHKTISDRVRCIEYVDANGNLGKVDMSTPELIKTAAGCFGLLGVVTHITFECDPISTAVMRPVKLDVMRAIPPPLGMPDNLIPAPLFISLTPEQRQKNQEEFEKRANNEYYAEWFWFPFSSKIFVNTWSTDENTSNAENYPSDFKTTLEVVGTISANLVQEFLKANRWLDLFPMYTTMFLSWISMVTMDNVEPSGPPIRTLVPNALHFQRGIQNLRVRDIEVEFPLLLKKGTQNRDYSNVQKAWWDAIIVCYENSGTCPQRMPLEMRIMGDSDMTMAPQRGFSHGTCSIEVLTLNATADIWEPYAQKVLDKWMSLKDMDGNPLSVRPHWAKEWQNYTVNGKPWPVVLKQEVYPEAIKEFKANLGEIARKQGLDRADLQRMYSNELLDFLFFDDIVHTEHYAASLGVQKAAQKATGILEYLEHEAHVIVEDLKHLVHED